MLKISSGKYLCMSNLSKVVIVLCLFMLLLYFYKKNKKLKIYKNFYKKRYKYQKDRYQLLGRKLNFSKFKRLKDDTFIYCERPIYQYLLVMVIPKSYCGQCIHEMVKYLNILDFKNVKVLIIGYNKINMKIKKNKYFIKKEVYYCDRYKWFKKNKIYTGPILLLVDNKSKKIINLYKKDNYQVNPIDDFFDFIKQL